ncbi:hypothetical protein LguiB_032575 [Lonicera macranthoides]
MFNHQPLYIPNKILNDSYVRVLDSSLRDGEQAPGATMTPSQKLAIAHQLAKLGVDIIEAGFPVSSPSEFETTRMIAMEVGNTVNDKTGRVPVIAGLSRLTRKDIDVTWEALKGAKYPRLLTFIPSSEIHMKYKIKKSKEEVLRSVKELVSYARGLGIMDIEFATEDSSRSEKEFLYQVFGEAIKAGATTIAFADTVGCILPNEWGQFIADMKANIVGVENVIIATHCHDDLGVATANTLAAVNAGAREVHVTMNGIGERAGNAPLEEFVMALKSRGKDLLGGLHTGINSRHILKASKMVEEHSGLSVQPNKAIVGANAFSHGSGIHQDGVLKNRSTYEFLSREEIGWSPSPHKGIVLGKLSGRHALKSRFLELGYELDTQKFDDAFRRFKLVAEKKKILSDNDLVLLMSDGDETLQPEMTWKLVDMEVKSSTNSLSRATIKLIDACGKEHVACGVGTNSIHAACKAIDDIVKWEWWRTGYDYGYCSSLFECTKQAVGSQKTGPNLKVFYAKFQGLVIDRYADHLVIPAMEVGT